MPFAFDEGHAAHEAHSLSPTVRRAVDIRKNALAKLPLCFYQGFDDSRTKIERSEGNIVDIWERSNPFGLVEELQASLDLNGNGYLVIEENALRQVIGFYTLPAHRTREILSKDDRQVVGYELYHRGRIFRFGADQVLHVMEYAPGLSIRGISPIKAAALSWKTGRTTQQLLYEVVRRGGEFSGMLISKDGRASIHDPAKQRRLKLAMKKRYRSPQGARNMVALPPGISFEKTMLTPAEMRLPELMRMSREQIYEVYGIPLWLVGMLNSESLGSGGASYSQERMFWEHTMDPVRMRLAWALTSGLLVRFQPDWSCEFDTSQVYCLQVAFLEKVKLAKEGCGRSPLSVNEVREFLGYEGLGAEFDSLEEIAPAGGGFGAEPGGNNDPAKSEKASAKEKEKDPKKKPQPKAPTYAHELEERRHHLERQMDIEAKVALGYVRRILEQQERRLLAEVQGERSAAAIREKRAIDITNLLSDADDDVEIAQLMFEDLVERRGVAVANEISRELDFDLHTARAEKWLSRHAGEMVTQINATTRELLGAEVAAGAGESMEGLVAIVRGVFDDRRENALTIARTESASAFNFATLEAARQSKGMVDRKRWVAVNDENTRDDHREADGQTVALEEPFVVGGYECDFPGDTGVAEQDCNCRCVVDFVLAEERTVRGALAFINRAMGKALAKDGPSRNGSAGKKPALTRS